MLPKHQRLNLKTDFKWVASGKRIKTPTFTLFTKVSDNTWPQVGVALSSKVFKKAHDRNKARRQTIAVVETIYSFLPKNINLVIMPGATISEMSTADLTAELKRGLNLI